MGLEYGFFYFFAGLAIVSAILMVIGRSVVHSAVFLIGALLATAGIYLQLRAEFLFIVQVILYVGGIMVLFVFVIMLVNLDVAARQRQFSKQLWLAVLLAIVLGAQLTAHGPHRRPHFQLRRGSAIAAPKYRGGGHVAVPDLYAPV
jgi:NADH:ubiquinone oxidoreductase subunit 6 (subunit J)